LEHTTIQETTMKISQEQINAALRYADGNDTQSDVDILHQYNPQRVLSSSALLIITSAYRELLEKNQEQKKYILELTEELDGWTSPD